MKLVLPKDFPASPPQGRYCIINVWRTIPVHCLVWLVGVLDVTILSLFDCYCLAATFLEAYCVRAKGWVWLTVR